MVDSPENHATPAAAAATAPARDSSTAQEVQEPTFKQLLRVGITKGLPFVAFGFFDNIIMITAGEQIDLMFGAKLGLSSMAAAGLGNTVADVVGINISHTIEVSLKQHRLQLVTCHTGCPDRLAGQHWEGPSSVSLLHAKGLNCLAGSH